MANVAAQTVASHLGRKRRGEGHTRRDEILGAAKALFLEEGYGATTIRKIAERVGVSAPALYLYFKDKDEIMLALCDQTFSHLINLFQGIECLECSPRDRLRQMGEAYIRFGLEHVGEYRLIFMEEQAPEPVRHTGHRSDISDPEKPGIKGAIAFAMLERQFIEIECAGAKLPHPPVTSAELAWMACHGLVSAFINEPDFPWSDRQGLIRGMVDLTVRGLAPSQ
jgi:AcrR family transcriptional regulator